MELMNSLLLSTCPTRTSPKSIQTNSKKYFISTHIPHHQPASCKFCTYVLPTNRSTNHPPIDVPNPGSSYSSLNSETQVTERAACSLVWIGSDHRAESWIEHIHCAELVADRPLRYIVLNFFVGPPPNNLPSLALLPRSI